MNKPYRTSEVEGDGIVRTWYIDTPNGRMKVVMPTIITFAEEKRRMKVIIDALNKAEKDRK